ncbi:TPA: GNAT family N-acetyltransferase [Candidatus Poribacteria bacterium]|nr:GNAT family N-acetyltransferase [Candidatus Poribacteria bacterium]
MITSDFYTPGDEEQINRLYNSVFDRNRSLKQWKWEFLDIPHGKSFIRVLKDGQDIIGHFSLLPFQVCNKDEIVLTGKTENIMLHHKYRGRGLYTEFAKESLELAKKEGFKAAWVTFTPAVETLKRAGYIEVMNFASSHVYVYPLSSDVFVRFTTRRLGSWASPLGAGLWLAFLLFKRAGKPRIDIEECTLSDYVSFFEDKWLPQQSRFSVFRSYDFLKWKFVDNPYGIQFRFVKFRYSDKVVAYAILVERERSIYIEDILYLDEAEEILIKAYPNLGDTNSELLTYTNTNDLPKILQCLKRGKSDGNMLVKDLNGDSRWLDPAHWYYTSLFKETID